MRLYSLLLGCFLAAAIAAAKNNTAKAQSSPIDSLKRVYSYEVCKQFINYSTKNINNVHPVVQHFPLYFKQIDTSHYYILPDYKIFNHNYGGGLNVDIKENDTYKSLKMCRRSLDSMTISICQTLMNDSSYRHIADKIINHSIDSVSGFNLLSEIEHNIRESQTQYKYKIRRKNQWTDRANTGHLYVPSVNGSTSGSHSTGRTINHGAFGGMTKMYAPNISAIPLSPVTSSKTKTSYITEYISYLNKANLASLRVILSDHIRRGVPIDISWIPEQALAEIEATKPVRQLKKQIKVLEKQQKQ